MSLITLGWREWVSLPSLGITHIKAKIDTGARSSCLHAFDVQPFTERGSPWVRFGIHPEQKNTELEVWAEAEVIDERAITDSGGHRETRPMIRSDIQLGAEIISAEISLTNRDSMLFRMLIGRTTLADKFLVSPSGSFLIGS